MNLESIKWHLEKTHENIGNALNHLSQANKEAQIAGFEIPGDNGQLVKYLKEMENIRIEIKRINLAL